MALEKEDEIIDKYLKQFKKNNDISVTDYAKQTTDAIQQLNKSITDGFERLIFMNQMMLTRSSNNENFYGGHAQERYSRFGRFSPDRNSRSKKIVTRLIVVLVLVDANKMVICLIVFLVLPKQFEQATLLARNRRAIKMSPNFFLAI